MQNLSQITDGLDITTKQYVDEQDADLVGIGDIKTTLGTPSNNWIECDGRKVSPAEYPKLSELLGSYIKKIEIPGADVFYAMDVIYFKGYYLVLGEDRTYSANPYIAVYAAPSLDGPWTRVFHPSASIRTCTAKAQFATDGNYLCFTNGGTGWHTSGQDNAYWYTTDPLGEWTKVVITHATAQNCYYHWIDYENGKFIFIGSDYQNANTGSIAFATDPTSAANWSSHVLGNTYAHFDGEGFARVNYHFIEDSSYRTYRWFVQPGESGLLYHSADFLSSFSYIMSYVSASLSSFVFFNNKYRFGDKNERYYVYSTKLFGVASSSGWTQVDMGKGNAPTYLMEYGSKLLGFNSTKLFLSSDGVSFETIPIDFRMSGIPIALTDGSYLVAGDGNYIIAIKSPEGASAPTITPTVGKAYIKAK